MQARTRTSSAPPALRLSIGAGTAGGGQDLEALTLEELAGYARHHARVVLAAPTWGALRRALVVGRLLGTTGDLTLRITDEGPPPHLATPALAGLRVLRWRCADDGASLRVRSPEPVAISTVLQAAVGTPRLLVPPLRPGISDRAAEPYAFASPHARCAGIDDMADGARAPYRVVDWYVATSAQGVHVAPAMAADPPPPPRQVLPPVDAVALNPLGSARGKRADPATATADGGGAAIRAGDGAVVLRWRPDRPLDRAATAALRARDWVRVTLPEDAPAALCRFVVEAAAAGAVVTAQVPPAARALLGEELAAAISVDTDRLGDPLTREAIRVRQSRAALRSHSPLAVWGRLGVTGAPPAVSALLVTKRPDMVAAAIDRIAAQTYPRLQLVVGLHGGGFDVAAIQRQLASRPADTQLVQAPEDVMFGDVLNLATAAASGPLLTKFDDDDGYGSEHVWDLVLAADYSGATVTGKGAEFTELVDQGVLLRRHARRGQDFRTRVAGGAMLFDRTVLDDIGGWRPLPRFVDDALLRQVTDVGGTIYRTHPFGYVLRRGSHGHTWDPGDEWFLAQDWPRRPVSTQLERLVLEQDTTMQS